MKNPIQVFEPNELGRDFVIGDLHGSYSCLETMLAGIQFDKTKDRLFSVGDLCDRGPDSLKCLELVYEPWFHCVLSNHESMMRDAFIGNPMGMFWLQNGGMWGVEALNDWMAKRPPFPESSRLFDLFPIIDELPYLITVKLKSGERVHVIHAELPRLAELTDEKLSDEEEFLKFATEECTDGPFVLWGRSLFYEFYGANLSDFEKVKRIVKYHSRVLHNDNLGRIVCGHTIVQKPLTIARQTNIDTGAFSAYQNKYKWAALTCLELDTWTFFQATPEEFKQVEPVVVNKSDIIDED